jgi:hypothetical protein
LVYSIYMHKNKIFLIFIVILFSICLSGYFLFQNQSAQKSPTLGDTNVKISLTGIVNYLNPSNPEDYSYELILDVPYYDELQASGEPNINQLPIMSTDKKINESINSFIGKKVTVEGSMEWGLAESRYLLVKNIIQTK